MSFTLLPYATYKESGATWLGKVPADWAIVPAFTKFKERQEKNSGFREKQVLSLSYGRIVKKHEDALHGLVPASFETYQIVNPGTLILRLTDLQNDQRSLRVGLVKDRGIITSAYLCLEPGNALLPSFAYYLLHAADVQKVFYGMGAGLRQSIGFKELHRLPLAIPSTEEQQQIIQFLDAHGRRTEKLIRAKRQVIARLNEQKQAIVNGALASERQSDWRRTRLKYEAIVQTGITLGKRYVGEELEEYPYLRVANVQNGYLDLAVIKTVQVPRSEAVRSRLRFGDVLMTEGGDIDKLGRGCVWRGEVSECLHQNHVFAVRTGSRLAPEFLGLTMISAEGRYYFQSTAKQTTNLASTNQTTIRNFPLLLPSIEDQRRIVTEVQAKFEQTDHGIRRTISEIELLREYRICLIADVVTGKLDVRGVELPDLEEAEGLESLTDVADDELEGFGELVTAEEGMDAAD